jgi:predicted AlkP superfamily pyrophosphatase or phosphodiesterase
MADFVAILGVDGAGNFFRKTDTPNIDALFAQGATTYDALTALPTISAQDWGAMLLGVQPEVHKLTNEIAKTTPYDVHSPYPSVFRVVRARHPEAPLSSICNWNAINVGIIEDNLGCYKTTGDSDAEICEKIEAHLEENSPKLLFVHFDEADGTGHRYGYQSKEHLAVITKIDGYIGRIAEAYKKKGIFDRTLFIVTADHGGLLNHGGDSDEEKLIFLGVTGPGVAHGEIRDAEVRDIAQIAATALDCPIPATWSGKVPQGVFGDAV